MSTNDLAPRGLLSLPVIIASLGYFVDIYDLLLFGIVRIPSLNDLGLSGNELSTVGVSILNWQMTGLFAGGIIWGVMGDKRGRLSVLFASILTYSLANIACGFVDDVAVYKLLRLIAGIGLAGELGAGITLVSEVLPPRLRAIGTSLVAGVGLLGAVFAYFIVQSFSWRNAYFIGGGMGLSLLALRAGVLESSMFKVIAHEKSVSRGNLLSLVTNRDRFIRYIKCVSIGLPTWFVIGILATFSNEFSREQDGIVLDPGLAIMWCYVGLAAGDLSSGLLSHTLSSRRRAIACMLSFTLLIVLVFLFVPYTNITYYYALIVLMGFGIGYWALFVTVSAEQFGTNLRATVTTTVPNVVRGTVVIMTLSYNTLKTSFTNPVAAMIVGTVCFVAAFISVYKVTETHNRDLNFLEE